jgi:hypothetical protein
VPLIEGDRIYPLTYLFQQDINTQETSLDRVEDPTPIVVSEGFGPDYHRYAGDYVLTFYACDFSDNCGYSRDFNYSVKSKGQSSFRAISDHIIDLALNAKSLPENKN